MKIEECLNMVIYYKLTTLPHGKVYPQGVSDFHLTVASWYWRWCHYASPLTQFAIASVGINGGLVEHAKEFDYFDLYPLPRKLPGPRNVPNRSWQLTFAIGIEVDFGVGVRRCDTTPFATSAAPSPATPWHLGVCMTIKCVEVERQKRQTAPEA